MALASSWRVGAEQGRDSELSPSIACQLKEEVPRALNAPPGTPSPYQFSPTRVSNTAHAELACCAVTRAKAAPRRRLTQSMTMETVFNLQSIPPRSGTIPVKV